MPKCDTMTAEVPTMTLPDAHKWVPWLSRFALFLGAVAIVTGMLAEHPLVHFGGKIHYPAQAIAIAKYDCSQFGIGGGWHWWEAELRRDIFDGRYIWFAGF